MNSSLEKNEAKMYSNDNVKLNICLSKYTFEQWISYNKIRLNILTKWQKLAENSYKSMNFFVKQEPMNSHEIISKIIHKYRKKICVISLKNENKSFTERKFFDTKHFLRILMLSICT